MTFTEIQRLAETLAGMSQEEIVVLNGELAGRELMQHLTLPVLARQVERKEVELAGPWRDLFNAVMRE